VAVVLGALLAGNPPGFGAVPAAPAALRVSRAATTQRARSSTAVACATFNRAYALASGGDVIEVAAGAYPGQSIGPAGSKSGPITFRPAPLAAVTVQHLSISASHVHVQNISATGSGEDRGGLDVCERECVPDVGTSSSELPREARIHPRVERHDQGGELAAFRLPRRQPEDAFRALGGSAGAATGQRVVVRASRFTTLHLESTTPARGQPNGIHVDCVQTQAA
jgi:hypothetical protein